MSIISSRLRSLAAALVLALTACGTAVLATAPPAAAQPCDPDVNPNCPPPPPVAYRSTLTVVPPAKGAIVGRDTGSDAVVFSCSAGGGTCSHTDTQYGSDGRPTDGWPQYAFTLDEASAPGYSVWFGGACTGSGTCTATNSAASATVTASVHDVQPPSVGISPVSGTRVAAGTAFAARASDNDSVAAYEWRICPTGSDCAGVLGTGATVSFPAGRTAGSYDVHLRVVDASGNAAYAAVTVTLVSSVDMTSSDVPAYAEHPSFTFSSTNEEAHVPADDQHRQCRAWADDTPAPDWGPCATANAYAPALADGSYVLQAREIDDLGLVGVVAHHVVIDTTAPTVAFTSGPADGVTIAAPSATYVVTAGDEKLASLTCAVNGTPIDCPGELDFRAPADGTYTITATAVDVLGHQTTATTRVTVLVPTVLGVVSSRSTYGRAAALDATVGPSGASGTVRFTSGRTLLCAAKVLSGHAKCVAPAGLTAGRHAVTATYGGNFASTSANLTLDVAKAATSIRLAVPRATRRGAPATLRITGLPRTATGVVVVTRGRHAVCTMHVHAGAATCRMAAPRRAGSYALSASYRGDGNHAGAHASARLRVT